jgi:Type II secretion system (T2SS), protein G
MRRWKVSLAGWLLLAAGLSFYSFVAFTCLSLNDSLRDQHNARFARVKAIEIENAVNLYHEAHGKYPDRLEDLTIPDSNLGNMPFCSNSDAILDPWGKPYQAEFPTDEGGKVRIWTTTPSGETVSNERKH